MAVIPCANRCAATITHEPCAGGSYTRAAYVSKYGCSHAEEAPIVIETIRFRLGSSGVVPTLNDAMIYESKTFRVRTCATYEGANRVVVDGIRVSLDPCRSETLQLYDYQITHGCSADELPEAQDTIEGVVVHDNHSISLANDSRQWVGTYRIYVSDADAAKLDGTKLLVGSTGSYKIGGVVRLGRMDSLPYAVASENNWKFAS